MMLAIVIRELEALERGCCGVLDELVVSEPTDGGSDRVSIDLGRVCMSFLSYVL